MPSLVESLQVIAADGSVPITDLLRRAKLVASKLNQRETASWVDSELGGYSTDVPEYRQVPSRLVQWNPFHGWIPIVFSDARINEVVSSPRALGFSIRELEELANGAAQTLNLSMPTGIQEQLLSWGVDGQATSQLSRASIVGVLDAVRNRVLDWALELERNGILGSNLSFSSEEKNRAQNGGPQIHIHGDIGNFSGVIGQSEGTASAGAEQHYRKTIEPRAAKKVAEDLRKGADDLAAEDATLIRDAADLIDDSADDASQDQSKLRRALRSAFGLLGKLGTWAAKAAVESEIHDLLALGS